MNRRDGIYLITIAALIGALLAPVVGAQVGGDDLPPGTYNLSEGNYVFQAECASTDNDYSADPLYWDVDVHDCVEPEPTATATAEPMATSTEAPPTATAGGHDTTVWHGPQGHTHEHGAPPPVWLPSVGPCANVAFEQMAIGRENHVFYKGYAGTTSNGVDFYIVNHIAPTIMGRSHGDHDETILARDTSGNVSCWQGIGHYSPTDEPTDPIDVFVKECGGNGPQGPVILVDCSLASESWYQSPGMGWCDNTTHVNGVWQDINGNNRGDGGSRHMEISCYAPRLPGAGAIYVAPTLAQDCVVQFGICQFKAVTSFAFDYTQPGVVGPN